MYQYKRMPLSQSEQAQLVNACQHSLERAVVFTLLDTGLRVSELARLTPADVDWQLHRLRIQGKAGPWGNGTKRIRIVPLSRRAQGVLEPWLNLHARLPGYRTIERLIHRVARRAEIPREVTPHVLRHTFAVEWIRRKGSTPALQRLLGHDRITTTEIYLNLSPEDVANEYRERFDH